MFLEKKIKNCPKCSLPSKTVSSHKGVMMSVMRWDGVFS